jgi:prepilin signal peptidase PulO-like enzyme (type II secretory pathway)
MVGGSRHSGSFHLTRRKRESKKLDLAAIVPFLTTYLILVGLLVGSFINLAADRLPRGESVIRPRSHCRACGRDLNAVDLIPVLGYALRGGRCASCRTPIGITAPIVEAVSGGCMLAGIALLGLWPGALAGSVLVALWGFVVIGFALRRRESARNAG